MMWGLGARHPILVLSYHNCEIHCCHLDGYKANTEALVNRLNQIEVEISSKPIHSKMRIWYNLDENVLNQLTMKMIAESIGRFQEHIYKIAFIGLRGISKWRFKYILKQTIGKNRISRAYFLDAELAKGWLV